MQAAPVPVLQRGIAKFYMKEAPVLITRSAASVSISIFFKVTFRLANFFPSFPFCFSLSPIKKSSRVFFFFYGIKLVATHAKIPLKCEPKGCILFSMVCHTVQEYLPICLFVLNYRLIIRLY